VWPHFVTAIGALRPALVVLENVQGHLTLGFDVVLADLAALGYDAEWVLVTASAAGAPHRRARLFVLAFPASGRRVTGAPVVVIRDGKWLEPRESLFGVLPFAGRIPSSGRMAGDRIYAAEDGPTEIVAGMLKTPTAQLAVNGGSQHPDKRRAGGHGPTLADQVEHELLPTPSAGNFNDGEDLASWEERRQRNLAKGINGNGQGTPLPIAAQQIAGEVNWGPYEAAIRRWEAVTGRPAPEPTVPGKTGRRLNSALPEWMMGLPAGWITDVPGLSRNAQLKLAGNGVVPAQCALALRILLSRSGFSLTEAGEAA
jgi:DNA (cytosine-5)-methyltransferase 1